MRALLDVNVLIALLDAGHIHHGLATNWLSSEVRHGWASCPITQNGCIRVMAHPAYPGNLAVGLVAERLAEAAQDPSHEFWPDDVNLLEGGACDWSRILGHRQVTDAYLLALAVKHGGRFVTLDRRIVPESLSGATSAHLVVLV
ncbi:MAG: PIN domain-containing protein [Deltaproteobacteria bacterium]